MAIQIFPNIKPNFIKPLDLPEYDISEVEWKSGFSNIIREGYQGIETGITLEYQHLSHTEAISLINFYNSVKGVNTGFRLPNNFIKFPDSAIDAIALLESTTIWKFASEPNFTLLVATPEIGRYNGSIQLKSASNDITVENSVATPSDAVYTVIAEPIPTTPPDNSQNIEIINSDGVISTNPIPILNTTQDNTRLLRTTTTLTITNSITVNQNFLTTVNLNASLQLLKISCSSKIRLRVYLSSTLRNADINRGIKIITTPNHGLLLDVVFNGIITDEYMTPNTLLYNTDITNKAYLLTITNLESFTINNFTITFNYLPIET